MSACLSPLSHNVTFLLSQLRSSWSRTHYCCNTSHSSPTKCQWLHSWVVGMINNMIYKQTHFVPCCISWMQPGDNKNKRTWFFKWKKQLSISCLPGHVSTYWLTTVAVAWKLLSLYINHRLDTVHKLSFFLVFTDAFRIRVYTLALIEPITWANRYHPNIQFCWL